MSQTADGLGANGWRFELSNALWFAAGAVVGAAAALLIARMWRQGSAERRTTLLRYGLPVVGAALFVVCLFAFSRMWGTSAAPMPATTSSDFQASHASAIDDYQRKVADDPRDATSWLALASLYRQQRQFAPARDAFARVADLDAMTADAWADYADVQASVSGSLAGEPETFMDRALALDPRHPKALWLKASLAHEQGKEDEALALWKRLRAVLPADSSDARLVENNIAEAERLAGKPALAVAPAAGKSVALSGTVALDPRFASRVKPGTPVFIYAKAVAAPGPPVAVMRTVTGSWPLRFTLDDSLAMMPERKLSNFDAVTVEARISPSGDATAQAGDLYAASATVNPRDGKALTLTISAEKR
jgi:cytochrome c-type biogenesis protein CcmH